MSEERDRGGPAYPAGPTQTMWADTSQLYAAAWAWEWDVWEQVSLALHLLRGGRSAARFGAVLAPVGEAHDEFAARMRERLASAARVVGGIGVDLRRTADDWVRTDDGAAEVPDRLRSTV